VDDIGSDEEVNDVIGEVCNMVGGDLKSRLCDAGFTSSLSIPSITYGESFRIQPEGWDGMISMVSATATIPSFWKFMLRARIEHAEDRDGTKSLNSG